MAKISISMADAMNDYVQMRVQDGQYNNVSEYFRDLVRRDQESKAKYQALKQSIQEGLESGVSEASLDDIWDEAEIASDSRHG